MKIVIDTGILVASLWEGKSRVVVDLWKKGELTLCVSRTILKEYLYILPRFSLFRRETEELLRLLEAKKNMEMVKPSQRIKVIKDDPADDKFLECALEGGAEYIISADKHLASLREYQGVKIVPSGRFLTEIGHKDENRPSGKTLPSHQIFPG